MTNSDSSVWDHWRRNLAGEDVTIHDGDPQWGYYRSNEKEGPDLPVAIYEADGKMIALKGPEDACKVLIADDVWTYVCNRPISQELYFDVFENGRQWPDLEYLPPRSKQNADADNKAAQDRPPQAGDNLPPEDEDTFEDMGERLEDLSRSIKRILDAGIKSKDDADNVANGRESIRAILKRADKVYRAEKEPLDKALTDCREKWSGLFDPVDELLKRVSSDLGAYLAAEQAKADAKAAEEAAEAERRALQERAEAAPGVGQAIEVPKKPKAAAKVRVGGGIGKRSGTRKIKKAKITDYPKLVVALQNEKELVAAVEKAANRLAKAGLTVDGMEIVEEVKA